MKKNLETRGKEVRKKILTIATVLVMALIPTFGSGVLGASNPTYEPNQTDGFNPTEEPTARGEFNPTEEPNPTGEPNPPGEFNETDKPNETDVTVDNRMPKGDLPGWKQVLADNFNGQDVPVGKFSDCNNNPDTPEAFCSGLPEPQKSRYWAYPKGWPDTAKQGTHGNFERSGIYNPEETISIGPLSNGDGVMRIKLFNNGGDNQVAAVVPKAMVGQKYGRYAIRFLAEATPGYKLAWLQWPVDEKSCSGCEIDFPEQELDTTIHGFLHHKEDPNNKQGTQDAFDSKQPYGVWHTAVTEWSPGKVKFILDGKEVGTSTTQVPDQPMSWVIQSESALNGDTAGAGTSARIWITWIAAYTYTGEMDMSNSETPSVSTEQPPESFPLSSWRYWLDQNENESF
jgi:hypothetical protein